MYMPKDLKNIIMAYKYQLDFMDVIKQLNEMSSFIRFSNVYKIKCPTCWLESLSIDTD